MNLGAVELRVLHAHVTWNPPDWSWDSVRNRWAGHHVWFLGGGMGRLSAPDRVYELQAGDCFVLRMDERHMGEQDRAHPLVVYGVHFQMVTEAGTAWYPTFAELPRHRRMADPEFTGGILTRCVRAHGGGRPNEAAAWLRVALLLIAEEDAKLEIRGLERVRAGRIDEICRMMRQRPERRYSLRSLARRLGCTPNHVIRLFRRHCGVTPTEFLIRTRIEVAKSMLRFSSLAVGEIAYHLGYCDPYFFSRQFKKRTGHAPSGFRAAGL